MAQASSNLFTPLKTPIYSPSFGVNTSTPSSAVFKPNTPLNISYGASSTVPSGQYTSNPTNNIFGSSPVSGVVNRSQPSPVMGSTLPAPSGMGSYGLTADQYAGVQKAQQTVANPPSMTNTNFQAPTGGAAGTPILGSSVPTVPNADGSYNPNGATQPTGYTAPTDPTKIQGLGTPTADTSTYQGLIKQAAEAQAAARNFNQNLTNAKTQVTQTGSDLPFQTGAQEGLQRTYGAQAQALTQAGSDAINLANSAKPQLAGYNQQSFNPLTGQMSGGDLQGAVSDIAEKVKNGTMSYADAQSALSGYGQGGTNALQQALGPNFNVNQSNAGAQVQGQQTQQVAQYKSALQQGQNLQAQLTDLITSFGLNPNDVNAVNSGLQAIARNTSSPQYKILQNYVNDIANTYSQILTPPGGSATDTTRGIASSMLDATAAGQSIISVMKSLDQAAQAKIAGIPTFNSQSNTGSSNNAPAGFAW